jgi:16S rRNA (cytosine967-C5)-methyltransferase
LAGNRQSAIGNRQFVDRILVDAPCSNTGVMRRRVDLRWRVSLAEISRLRQTQLELLKLAAAKLRPGGVLIYSTCSLEPEENSEVVKEFLREHAGFKLENERALLPFADNVDGAYVARLKHST